MSDIKINNKDLPLHTRGRWLPRRPIGVQGDNRPVYAPVREFELRWNLTYHEDWAVLVAFFEDVQSTGTVVALLPAYPTATGTPFAYREYSGCTLDEPEIGDFFNEQYPQDVTWKIRNILTS